MTDKKESNLYHDTKRNVKKSDFVIGDRIAMKNNRTDKLSLILGHIKEIRGNAVTIHLDDGRTFIRDKSRIKRIPEQHMKTKKKYRNVDEPVDFMTHNQVIDDEVDIENVTESDDDESNDDDENLNDVDEQLEDDTGEELNRNLPRRTRRPNRRYYNDDFENE